MSSKADEPGWEWFEQMAGQSHEKEVDQDLAADFKTCFQSEAGKRVLFHLMDKTLGRAVSGHVRAPLLSHLEGQRYLVKYILAQLRTVEFTD